jgi:hypothetical protein
MDNILQVLLLHTTDYHNTLPLQNKNKNNKYIKNLYTLKEIQLYAYYIKTAPILKTLQKIL